MEYSDDPLNAERFDEVVEQVSKKQKLTSKKAIQPKTTVKEKTLPVPKTKRKPRSQAVTKVSVTKQLVR